MTSKTFNGGLLSPHLDKSSTCTSVSELNLLNKGLSSTNLDELPTSYFFMSGSEPNLLIRGLSPTNLDESSTSRWMVCSSYIGWIWGFAVWNIIFLFTSNCPFISAVEWVTSMSSELTPVTLMSGLVGLPLNACTSDFLSFHDFWDNVSPFLFWEKLSCRLSGLLKQCLA